MLPCIFFQLQWESVARRNAIHIAIAKKDGVLLRLA